MRKIVLLDRSVDDAGRWQVRYVLRLVVPAVLASDYQARQRRAGSVLGAVATAAEQAEVRAGAVVELEDVLTVDPPTTVSAVKAALVARLGAAQAALDGSVPWAGYGQSYDGTAWTI